MLLYNTTRRFLPSLLEFSWMVPRLARRALVFASLSWRGFWGGVLANHQLHSNGFPLLQRPGTPPRFVTCFPPQPMLLLLAAGSSSVATTTILSLLSHPKFHARFTIGGVNGCRRGDSQALFSFYPPLSHRILIPMILHHLQPMIQA